MYWHMHTPTRSYYLTNYINRWTCLREAEQTVKRAIGDYVVAQVRDTFFQVFIHREVLLYYMVKYNCSLHHINYYINAFQMFIMEIRKIEGGSLLFHDGTIQNKGVGSSLLCPTCLLLEKTRLEIPAYFSTSVVTLTSFFLFSFSFQIHN